MNENYQMPKKLFKDKNLQTLHINAKLLYTLLLEKIFTNGFLDEKGRVFIISPQSEFMKLINCGRTKMSEYFKELDKNGGVGLIERIQNRGNQKSDIIYIKNFNSNIDDEITEDFAYFTIDSLSNFKFEAYDIPKMLFTDEKIKHISNRAKLLYCYIFDKISLLDKYSSTNRTYIRIDRNSNEIKDFLNCSSKTIGRCLNELRTENGVGLINIDIHYGDGKLSKIYILD